MSEKDPFSGRTRVRFPSRVKFPWPAAAIHSGWGISLDLGPKKSSEISGVEKWYLVFVCDEGVSMCVYHEGVCVEA